MQSSTASVREFFKLALFSFSGAASGGLSVIMLAVSVVPADLIPWWVRVGSFVVGALALFVASYLVWKKEREALRMSEAAIEVEQARNSSPEIIGEAFGFTFSAPPNGPVNLLLR